METFPENGIIKELLPSFYKMYRLPADGGIKDKSVKVEFTEKLFYYIPNWDTRREVLFNHDVHHIITGYNAVLDGEAQIASWELASNCSHNWAAFMLNSQGLFLGAFAWPKKAFKAYVRGKQTKNLYHCGLSEDEIRNASVVELRALLHLDKVVKKAKPIHYLQFIWMFLKAAAISIPLFALTPLLLLYSLKVHLEKRQLTAS